MAVIGKSNLSGGETLEQRVSPEQSAIFERVNGFEPLGNSLVPIKHPAKLNSGAALSGTTPEGTPFAFVDSAETKIIVRDSTGAFRYLTGGSWSSAGDILAILEENTPTKVGDLIVYGSDGAHPRLMAFEPNADSTGALRPLSMKCPTDYKAGEKPTITASAAAGLQLFDNDDANVWAIANATYGSVANSADKTIVTLDSDAPANTLVAKKSLAAATKSPTGKMYLVIDYKITADVEPTYPYSVYANDPGLFPSGFLLGLYSDTACTSLIVSYRLPNPVTYGAVTRAVIALGDQTTTIQGVGLLTDTFFTVPEVGDTYTVTFWSEAFSNTWGHKGNFLYPGVKWDKSPFATTLAGLLDVEAGEVELPPSGNLVINGSFEDSTTGWTLAGGAARQTGYARSGTGFIELDHANESFETAAMITGIVAGKLYQLDVYYEGNDPKGAHAASWRRQIDWYTAGDVAVSSTYLPGPAVGDVDYESYELGYRLKRSQVTAPATAAKCKVHIEAETDSDSDTYHDNFRIDDVSFYALNQATTGAATILQTCSEDMTTDKKPADPQVQWCYVFAARDRLGSDRWSLILSNPSGPSREDPFTFADPWRTYTVAVTLPSGPINTVAAAPTAAGTGYQVGDVLLLEEGDGAKVEVLTVTGTAVATVGLIAAGSGVTTGTGKVTVNETDATGTGCTVNVTDILTPIEEYGSYLTHILIYRRIYDGETEQWSKWIYIGYDEIAASMSYSDEGNDIAAPLLQNREVPHVLDMTNDYLSWGARYTMYSDRRIWAMGLEWSEEDSKWLRPTAISVSAYEKPHAFTTTTTQTDHGVFIDGYAVGGAEIRGGIVRGEERYVFLDCEFFLFHGDDPITGFQAIYIDSIGLISNRTLVDAHGMLIWHDGHHFYRYMGGLAENISEGRIDSTKIDFTHAHNCVYYDGKYIFWCDYDSTWSLLIYDIARNAWRTRRADSALVFVGICTDGDNVYGVTTGGNAVNVFSSATTEWRDAGAASPTYQLWTRPVWLRPPNHQGHSSYGVFEIATDQGTGYDLALDYITYGQQTETVETNVNISSARSSYQDEVNLHGAAVATRMDYTGTAPPTAIHFMGLDVDEEPDA